MKTRNIFAQALLFTVFAVTGCSGFLDEKNLASQSAEAFYATKDGYESLMSGAYNTLKSVYNSTNYYSLAQLGTDLSTHNNGNTTNQLNQYTPDYLSDNGTVFNQWKTLYEALKNVNAVIGRADAVVTKDQDPRDGMDKEVVAQHVAEAKFLRALYLFEIVRNWGQAPLILDEPTSASTESTLDSGDAFYDQILEDLEDVIGSSLPWKQPAANYGRVSKAAAKHLREANEENDEIIFPVNFSAGSGWNNNIWSEFYLFVYREGWNDIGFSGLYRCDWATVMPTKYAYLLFDWKKDHRAEVTFMSPMPRKKPCSGAISCWSAWRRYRHVARTFWSAWPLYTTPWDAPQMQWPPWTASSCSRESRHS